MEDGGDCQNSGYYYGYAHLVALPVSIYSVAGAITVNKITRAKSAITRVTQNHRNFREAAKTGYF